MSDSSTMLRPRHLGASIKAFLTAKRLLDQRAWFEYLRREAVVRALKPPDGNIRDQATVEAAQMICAVLQKTPIPGEVEDGLFDRLSAWGRRKVSWGIRYPEYSDARSFSFYRRLAHWVREAVSSVEGQKAMNYARYPLSDERAELFAIAVANETQGLLAEAGVPKGQDTVRAGMAAVIHRTDPDRDVKSRHKYFRRIIASASAGIGTSVTTIIFSDDWGSALGLGGVATVGAAVTSYLVDQPKLRDDILAGRRQVARWLKVLPQLLLPFVQMRNTSATSHAVTDLEQLLLVLSRGEAILSPIPRESTLYRSLEEVSQFISEVDDFEMRAALADIKTAVMFDLGLLPDALLRLTILLRGSTELAGTYDVTTELLGKQPRGLPPGFYSEDSVANGVPAVEKAPSPRSGS